MKKTHWMYKTRFYSTWCNLYSRCNRTYATRYSSYWWRWIKCEWKSFEEFKVDMFDSYLEKQKEIWEKNISIERLNVDWNYCKENCIWIHKNKQSDNTRRCFFIEKDWEKLNQAQRARKLWLNVNTVRGRKKRWLPLLHEWKLKQDSELSKAYKKHVELFPKDHKRYHCFWYRIKKLWRTFKKAINTI